VKRREFITLIGGAAAWPLAAHAQQAAMPVIGWLASGTSKGYAAFATAFRQGLNETGYAEGRNLAIEYRWAEEGQFDRLPAIAADLVQRQVTIIAAAGTPSAFAAKAATATIPIVFSTGGDPVTAGLVASLNRPGGNLTGVSNFVAVLAAKQFELLHELVPNTNMIGVLVNPTDPNLANYITRDLQEAGRALGQQIQVLNASTEDEIDASFRSLAQLRVGATIIGSDPFFTNQRDQIIALAARYRIPAMYYVREFTLAGGLITYGASIADGYRQVGIYAGKILKGAKPADLPILQPTKFELTINLKTAKALGLTVPVIMQMTANEVIE
jgi:putative ABC transport system substrate-binding protein